MSYLKPENWDADRKLMSPVKDTVQQLLCSFDFTGFRAIGSMKRAIMALSAARASMPAKVSSTIRRFQLAGGAFFLISFLLPAIRIDPALNPNPATLRGYQCAEGSAQMLYQSIKALRPHDGYWEPWTIGFIFGVSGLLNMLVIWYLLAAAKWRRRVAILICALILETWIGLALSQLSPLYGHFVWVAGMLLMLAPEVSAWEDGSES
jgi:hypothetical protein